MKLVDWLRGTRPTSTFARTTLNESVVDGQVVVVSKLPGTYGNRLSVSVEIRQSGGKPVLSYSGNSAHISISSKPIFESSGPFFVNGVTPTIFDWLWPTDDHQNRPCWSIDGLPVTWPLNRDGSFMVFADGSWNMIQRASGVVTMHWKSDSQASDIYLIPRAEKSLSTPDGWYGGIPTCTGFVDAHYGIDNTEAQWAVEIINNGVPSRGLDPNPDINLRMLFELPSGQSGTGKLQTLSPKALVGGR